MTVNTNRKEYVSFNGFEIKVINTKRDDEYIEVFVPAFGVFILLLPSEIED